MCGDTIPWFQFCKNSLKPVPSAIPIGLVSFHLKAVIFSVRASGRAADSELVAGDVKCESRCGCFVGIPDPRPCSFGRTFSRFSFKLVVLEWSVKCSLHNLHTNLPRSSTILGFALSSVESESELSAIITSTLNACFCSSFSSCLLGTAGSLYL